MWEFAHRLLLAHLTGSPCSCSWVLGAEPPRQALLWPDESQRELIRVAPHWAEMLFLLCFSHEGWTQRAPSDEWSVLKALVGLIQRRCGRKEPFPKMHPITWLCKCVSQARTRPPTLSPAPCPRRLDKLWNCVHSLWWGRIMWIRYHESRHDGLYSSYSETHCWFFSSGPWPVEQHAAWMVIVQFWEPFTY